MLLGNGRGKQRKAPKDTRSEKKELGEISDLPALFFVELVTHTFGELSEVTFRLCVVAIDHKVLEVP